MKEFTKYLITLVFIILLYAQVFGQNAQVFGKKNNSFYFNCFYSEQKVDKRLVGLTEWDIERFIKMNEETPPDLTKHFGFEIGKELFSNRFFSISTALGYSFEKNNYIRLFFWQALLSKDEPHFLVPRYLDVYSYHLLGFNFVLSKKVTVVKSISLNGGIKNEVFVRFSSHYQEALITHEKRVYNKPVLYSFEVNPFIGVKIGNIELNMYYRLYLLKHIDRAIFEKNQGYGGIDNDYETYNLPKFGISLKYWFGFMRKKENKPINIDK